MGKISKNLNFIYQCTNLPVKQGQMLIPVKKNVISQETFDIHNKMLYGDENLKLFKE